LAPISVEMNLDDDITVDNYDEYIYANYSDLNGGWSEKAADDRDKNLAEIEKDNNIAYVNSSKEDILEDPNDHKENMIVEHKAYDEKSDNDSDNSLPLPNYESAEYIVEEQSAQGIVEEQSAQGNVEAINFRMMKMETLKIQNLYELLMRRRYWIMMMWLMKKLKRKKMIQIGNQTTNLTELETDVKGQETKPLLS